MNDKDYKVLIINKFDKLEKKIEKSEKNLGDKIKCLETKLLDPDNGLFARVKENTIFRRNAKRVFFMIIAGMIGTICYIIKERF